MSATLQELVQGYLHPLERVQVAIEADLVGQKQKRTLAVVINDSGRTPEAAYVDIHFIM